MMHAAQGAHLSSAIKHFADTMDQQADAMESYFIQVRGM